MAKKLHVEIGIDGETSISRIEGSGFDLIEAAMVCECQAAQIINGLKRKGLDLDAQKLATQNARLARLVRRMQETKERRT